MNQRILPALLHLFLCPVLILQVVNAATFTVINTNDSGAGSLRQALTGATTSPAADTINFSITGSPPHTIALLTGLPVVPQDTDIFADTQTGFTLTNPVVRLVPGAPNGITQDVFRVSNGNCEFRGFHISGFTNRSAFGISGNSNKVAANILVDNINGVWISGGDFNQVGGFVVADRNIISSNRDIGVRIDGFGTPSNNVVAGNFIGTDVTGTKAWPNRLSGIVASDAPGTVISGTSTAVQVLSGNSGAGVNIGGTNAFGTRIHGNFIGTDVTGTQSVSNEYGVSLDHARGVTVGGNPTNGLANYISGNDFYGVRISGTNSRNNVVLGNYIGLGTNGLTPVPNRNAGVALHDGAWSNRIGGMDSDTFNIIAGNGGEGVYITDSNTHHNTVTYNLIGLNRQFAAVSNDGHAVYILYASTNTIGPINYLCNSPSPGSGITIFGPGAAGNRAIGNIIGFFPLFDAIYPNYIGIRISGVSGTTIGGTNLSDRNYISGNFGHGISVEGNSSNTVIIGNFIGNGLFGTEAVSNQYYGINLEAPFNTIGGPTPNHRNYISGNPYGGIYCNANASNTWILGNYIGTDFAGTNYLPNGHGISIHAPDVTVGGTSTNHRNIISGNLVNGVELFAGADRAKLTGNYIGSDPTGTRAVSNRQHGVIIDDANDVVVGGTGAARNVIVASRLNGVTITGTASNTLVIGNYIGLSTTGTNSIRNGSSGVNIDADYVTVGGSSPQEGNYISGNQSYGIEVNTGRHIRIIGNTIGLGTDGLLPLGNAVGVRLRANSWGVILGGTNTAQANVISKNAGDEVSVEGPSGGHLIQGNFIGVRPFGSAFPSVQSNRGIQLQNSPSNQILGNVIGQVGEGLRLQGTGTYATVVQGNFIGEYLLEAMGNAFWGIEIIDSSDNLIGGLTVTQRNVIANNNGGITVTNTTASALNNRISPNLIFSNHPRLNIDLGSDGFTDNDALDADNGPNRLQNRPVLTNGLTTGFGIVYAQGILTSAPMTMYAVDIYRSDSTNADGRIFIGRTTVNTDAGGVGTFSAGFPFNVAGGSYLAAVAIDPDGNTSEFSASPTGIVLQATGDTDNDGIPDYWETLYGLNPASSNDVVADADMDGYTDKDEYFADTAANDDTKYPVITEIANAANRLVSFPSSNLRVYNLHANMELVTNDVWAPVGGSVTGQFGFTTMTDTNLPDRQNYRVGVRLP